MASQRELERAEKAERAERAQRAEKKMANTSMKKTTEISS
jgi:hypothetical protein